MVYDRSCNGRAFNISNSNMPADFDSFPLYSHSKIFWTSEELSKLRTHCYWKRMYRHVQTLYDRVCLVNNVWVHKHVMQEPHTCLVLWYQGFRSRGHCFLGIHLDNNAETVANEEVDRLVIRHAWMPSPVAFRRVLLTSFQEHGQAVWNKDLHNSFAPADKRAGRRMTTGMTIWSHWSCIQDKCSWCHWRHSVRYSTVLGRDTRLTDGAELPKWWAVVMKSLQTALEAVRQCQEEANSKRKQRAVLLY